MGDFAVASSIGAVGLNSDVKTASRLNMSPKKDLELIGRSQE